MKFRVRLSLLAVGSQLLLLLVMGLLLRHLESLTQHSVMQASEQVLTQTAAYLEDAVKDFLAPAPQALADLQRQFSFGTNGDLEKSFFQTLHGYPRLAELTFTDARERSQLSVFRGADGTLVTQKIVFRKGRFERSERQRKPDRAYQETAWKMLGKAANPTEHPTFTTPRDLFLEGDKSPVWSDLSYSQIDAQLPESKRRVGVTVQGPVVQPDGKLAGIARIGLTTRDIDHAFDNLGDHLSGLPYMDFLCDSRGRLITPVLPLRANVTARIVEDDGDLRVQPSEMAPVVSNILKRVPEASANNTTIFVDSVGGEQFLACVRPLKLENTEDWRVALVIPESAVAGKLLELRTQLLHSALLAALAIAIATGLLLWLLRRELNQLFRTARQMRDFDFRANPVGGVIQDLTELASSLEAAKTTLRAMVKYVPVELVRQLFEARLEPTLGSQARTVVLMFSDIRGFTSLAERITPDELSRCLGDYLTAMNGRIHEHHGTVLERVGDALLSLWNAPVEIEHGEELACRCALLCRQSIAELPMAKDLHTRFGIHRDRVLVGHFGSPERLNYGVLGDGVNLASRLEGLNKHYGTNILMSQAVREQLSAEFAVRKLDVVAVKGKHQGIEIYELLGLSAGLDEGLRERAVLYERAWLLYRDRQFLEAEVLLQPQADMDPPSAKLVARCRLYAHTPPPQEWDGTYLAQDK